MRKQIARLVAQECDLSLRQLHALFELSVKGTLTIKALSESVPKGMDKPAVSRAVDRLKELGYVDRNEHPTDRRSVLVSLTKAGSAFIRGAERE